MINFLINAFYILFKKHEKKGVLVSIWLVTLALGFNTISIFHLLLFFIGLNTSYDLMYSVLVLSLLFYGLSILLERKYLIEGKFRYTELPLIFGLIGPLYILLSLFVFPLTFRFFPHM